MGKRLTVAACEKLKTKTRLEAPDGGGLYLVVQKSGSKSWALRYKRRGKSVKLTLGSYDPTGGNAEPKLGDPLSLVEARALAHGTKLQINRGVDPTVRKKHGVTFYDAARKFVEERQRPKNRTWRKQARDVIGLIYSDSNEPKVCPGSLVDKWYDLSVEEIEARDVRRVVNQARLGIPGRKVRVSGPSTSREREMVKALAGIFKYARRQGLDVDKALKGIDSPEEKGESRKRVLTDDELERLWHALDESSFGRGVKLMILTGARSGEVFGMRHDEVAGDTWTIPAARSKNKRAHAVPLSKFAMDQLPSGDGFVFSTDGGRTSCSISKPKAKLDTVLKFKEPWRLHDIRRSVATGLERLGVPLQVTEAVLNHVSGSKSGIVGIYQKHDYPAEKRTALDKWSEFVRGLVSEKIVRLRTENRY